MNAAKSKSSKNVEIFLKHAQELNNVNQFNIWNLLEQ